MELKPDENTHLFKAIRRSNRTFMELKLNSIERISNTEEF